MSALGPKRTSRGKITARCPPSSVLGYADTMPRLEPRGEEMMRPWHLLQRYRQYTSHALWVVPFSAIILELVLYRLLRALDDMLGWQLQRFSASGAQAMLEAIITMALSFVVFTFGSLLVAIQVASGQLTPRIIATTYESCNRRVSVVPIGGEDYRRQDSRKSGKGVQSGRRGGNGRCPQPQAQAASIRCFR